MAEYPRDSQELFSDSKSDTVESFDGQITVDQEWLGETQAEDYEDGKYDLTPEEEIERERYSAELWEDPSRAGADKSALFPDHLLTPEEQIERDLLLGEEYRGSWGLGTASGLGFPANEDELESDERTEQNNTLHQMYRREQGLDDDI
ncbi:MAG TPA: hypothetical protein VGE59_02085 [Patescibacteria group bacterium]